MKSRESRDETSWNSNLVGGMGLSCKRNETKLILVARYIIHKLYSIYMCIHTYSEWDSRGQQDHVKWDWWAVKEKHIFYYSGKVNSEVFRSTQMGNWKTLQGYLCWVSALWGKFPNQKNGAIFWCPKNHRFWLAIFSFFMLEIANQIHYNIPALPNSFLGRQERVGCV